MIQMYCKLNVNQKLLQNHPLIMTRTASDYPSCLSASSTLSVRALGQTVYLLTILQQHRHSDMVS